MNTEQAAIQKVHQMKSADDKDAVNHVNIEITAKESQVFCDSPD